MTLCNNGYGKAVNRERNRTFSQLLLEQLGTLEKGHYRQSCSKHRQHLCACALESIHDLCGLEYTSDSSDQRPMVSYGFGKMD
jgi:hypothetical protein